MDKEAVALRINSALSEWWDAEVRSSGVVINGYLDDYVTAVRGLRGGWEHPDNFTARKNEAHVDIRLPQAWQTFEMSLQPNASQFEKDYQSAYLLFTPKMQVSGTFRTQCYLEAQGTDDENRASNYLERRHSRPAGIDILHATEEVLDEVLPPSGDIRGASVTTESLKYRLDLASEVGRKMIELMCERTMQKIDESEESDHLDIGVENSPSVVYMKTAQKEWVVFCITKIIHDAKLRNGKLNDVPFLDAKSITASPEIYHPFRGEQPPVLATLVN
jgi:hypothetical protein